MDWKERARTISTLLLITWVMLMGCNLQVRVPQDRLRIQLAAAQTITPLAVEIEAQPATATAVPIIEEQGSVVVPVPQQSSLSLPGEPAGCLTIEEAKHAGSTEERLARAAQLLGFSKSLSTRILTDIWNPYTRRYYTYLGDVLGLNVDDVQNKHFIQKIMDALQVNGYITWLRKGEQGRLQILAIPIWRGDWSKSNWAPYVEAYWQDGKMLPANDSSVIPVVKTPPCRWMVAEGLAPQVGADWLKAGSTSWPNYASAAAAYLADNSQSASVVARRIGWLEEGLEGPNTMCGPLAWAILHDSGAFPPGWGGWSEGPIAFWLAKPRTNGRPWSLFPSETYRLYQFHEPLKKFDFSQFALYPGDFIYTYSERNGFDHMMVITEVDQEGNVYSVTNLIQVSPEKKTTIERALVLNLNDPTVGVARNQWANDGANGRTGHDGFDVFRWVWVEKDMRGEPAKYTVQAGDTLQRIAAFWKTPAERIAQYNGVAADILLTVGQELQIPPNETPGAQE